MDGFAMPLTSDQKRERQRLASQRYNAAHREEKRAYQKAYGKAYYAAHRKEKRVSDKAYYAAHREEKKASAKAYHAAHPDIGRAGEARRRARKIALPSMLTAPQWQAVVVAYKGKCAYCGAKPKKLTIDHVLPLARGGHHTTENVVPACLPCNSRKRAGPPPFIPSLRLLL